MLIESVKHHQQYLLLAGNQVSHKDRPHLVNWYNNNIFCRLVLWLLASCNAYKMTNNYCDYYRLGNGQTSAVAVSILSGLSHDAYDKRVYRVVMVTVSTIHPILNNG